MNRVTNFTWLTRRQNHWKTGVGANMLDLGLELNPNLAARGLTNAALAAYGELRGRWLRTKDGAIVGSEEGIAPGEAVPPDGEVANKGAYDAFCAARKSWMVAEFGKWLDAERDTFLEAVGRLGGPRAEQ